MFCTCRSVGFKTATLVFKKSESGTVQVKNCYLGFLYQVSPWSSWSVLCLSSSAIWSFTKQNKDMKHTCRLRSPVNTTSNNLKTMYDTSVYWYIPIYFATIQISYIEQAIAIFMTHLHILCINKHGKALSSISAHPPSAFQSLCIAIFRTN